MTVRPKYHIFVDLLDSIIFNYMTAVIEEGNKTEVQQTIEIGVIQSSHVSIIPFLSFIALLSQILSGEKRKIGLKIHRYLDESLLI